MVGTVIRKGNLNQKVQSFEDLKIWKESMRLATDLYQELKDCKDFSLRDQIQRAAVSIPSNIAEGFERDTNKEFIRFLYISKGSCGELRTQLYIAHEVGILKKDAALRFIHKAKEISSMLHGLIKTRCERFN